MACILCIETATPSCSVALAKDGEVLFEKVSSEQMSHSAVLAVYIEEALSILKEKNLSLDAVAVSSGPGSYTGLRIGTSTAKGLCFGFDIPLISLSTLSVLTAGAIRITQGEKAFYCPMIDARRMEVYAAVYDEAMNELSETEAVIVDESSFASFLEQGKVYFFGNGAPKTASILTSANAQYIDYPSPIAAEMVAMAEKAYANSDFVDKAYFEPFYLKEFVATIAKNKVLPNNEK